MRNLLFALMAVTILVCGCVYLTGCTTVKSPPVITSFNASPASIDPGGSSTLSWTVTGAKSVSLDNGVGNVAVNGSRAVVPSATTVYVLTASNVAGSTTASTQIIVSGTSQSSSSSATGTDQSTSPSSSGTTDTSTGTTTPVNPAMQFIPATPFVTTQYDFITHAPEAMWVSNDSRRTYGAPSDHGEVNVQSIRLEDGNSPKVLTTIPDYAPGGYIWGAFTDIPSSYTVKSGDRFTSKIGYIKDAIKGDANFIVKVKPAGSDSYIQITRVRKTYTGTLATIDVPLSAYAGKNISVELRVEDNNTTSSMDWTVWVNPRIIR